MSTAEEVEGALSNLRELAIAVATEVATQAQIPCDVHGSFDHLSWDAIVDCYHKGLVEAHHNMIERGLTPDQCVNALLQIGRGIVDQEIPIARAAEAAWSTKHRAMPISSSA
jgi:hypothetical protein